MLKAYIFCRFLEDEIKVEYKEYKLEPILDVEKTYSCRKCNLTFPTLRLSKRHRYLVHYFDKFPCPECDRKFSNRVQLAKHSSIHSNPVPYFRCNICEETFNSVDTFETHKKYHEEEKLKWKCCGKQYRSAATFQRHFKFSHNEEQTFTCEVCGRGCPTRSAYYTHKQRHKEGYKERFACTLCDKSFTEKKNWINHNDVVHKGQKHLCHICGKETNSKHSMTTHMKTHAPEKTLACTYCNKKFVHSKYLRVHLRVHTKEKPYVCKTCGKGFTQAGSLTLHVKSVHTQEKPYKCVICSKSFVSKSLLNSHAKTHSLVKSH